MEVADKIAVVDKYVEAFDKADIGIIREIYAQHAVVEDPMGSDPHQGIEAVVGFYESALAMGVKLELSGTPRCAGDAVAFPFRVIIGEMKIEAIDIFEFDESGKVTSMKAYWGPENTS